MWPAQLLRASTTLAELALILTALTLGLLLVQGMAIGNSDQIRRVEWTAPSSSA